MSENNTFKNNMDALMGGVDGVLSTKTVVGEAVIAGDNIIIPLADVSFGAGTGTFDNTKNRSAGAVGAKISPAAVLVINQNGTKMVPVKGAGAVSKIIDMIPDIAAKFTGKKEDKTEA